MVQSCIIGNTVVVVPGTTKPGGSRVRFSVCVQPNATNVLKEKTYFLPSQVRAIDCSRIDSTLNLGKIDSANLGRIDEALREVLGL
jgi:mRNA-degrading endonuclease toxin of MazEF toxin-antitoxin module